MLEHLTNYILGAMVSFAPPSIHAYEHETIDHAEARYYDIASDIATVMIEDDEPFEVFADEQHDVGIAHSALLLASIASFESGGFRADIDRGHKRGDSGHSVCILQIWVRDGEQVRDRSDCVRLGIARVRESLEACRSNAIDTKLSVYASGSCSKGVSEARHRWARMEQFWNASPFYGSIDEESWLDDQD